MSEEIRNEVVVTIEGQDSRIPMESLGLTMDSSETVILNAIRPMMREIRDLDMADDDGEMSYTVRKALNSNTIYVYPKPVAG
jgi:hypothetical protein